MPDRPNDPRLQRRRPTDAELDRESEITESDLDAAVDAWHRYAPQEAKGAIAAKPTDAT
jgi:hypothetical protein